MDYTILDRLHAILFCLIFTVSLKFVARSITKPVQEREQVSSEAAFILTTCKLTV